MAFPVVEGVAESSVDTAGTSHTITLPSGITSTDYVLLLIDIGSTAASFNALTDWTESLDEAVANGLKIIRYTGSGVPSNPTFTSSASTRSATIAMRISRVDRATAPVIGTTATGTSTTPNPPQVSAPSVTTDCLFIAFYGAAGEEADDDTWSDAPPTNYGPTPPYQKACGTAGTNLGGMIAAATRQLTTSSVENPGTFTKDLSSAWRAQTIRLDPVPPVAKTFALLYDVEGEEPSTVIPNVTSIVNTTDITTGAFTLGLPGSSESYVAVISGQGDIAVTPGSNWTLLETRDGNSPTWNRIWVYYANASDSPGTSWSWSAGSGNEALACLVAGLDVEIDSINAEGWTDFSGEPSSFDCPSVTTTLPALIFRVVATNNYNSTTHSVSYPSSTENQDTAFAENGGSNDATLVAIATHDKTDTGSTGTATYAETGSSTNFVPITGTFAVVGVGSGLTPVAKTFALQHDVKAAVPEVFALQHDVKALVLETFAIQHDVRVFSGKTFALQHDIKQRVAEIFSSPYDVKALTNETFQLLYDIRTRVTEVFSVQYDVRSITHKDFVLSYDLIAFISKLMEILYDVESAIVSVGKSIDIQWDVRSQVREEFNVLWDILTKTQKSFELPWDVKGLVLEDFDIKWDVESNIAIGESVGSYNDNRLAFFQQQLVSSETDLNKLEWQYYTGLSGLTPPEDYTLEDHKYAYFDSQVVQVPTDATMADLEYAFLKAQTGGSGSLRDLQYLYYRPT